MTTPVSQFHNLKTSDPTLKQNRSSPVRHHVSYTRLTPLITVVLERQVVPRLVYKIVCLGTQRFIILFTWAHHWISILNGMNRVYTLAPCLTYILIVLFRLQLEFPSGPFDYNFYALVTFIRPSNPASFYHFNNVWFTDI